MATISAATDHAPPAWRHFALPCVVVVLLAAVGWTIHADYEKALSAAERQSAGLAHALDEHLTRTVNEIDQVMAFLKTVYERTPEDFDITSDVYRAITLKGSAFQIAFVNPDGEFQNGTLGPTIHQINLRKEEAFRAHADRPALGLYVAARTVDPVTGRPAIPLSRRVNYWNGAFAGVLIAALDPGFFAGFLASVNLGPHGRFTVMRADGLELATLPEIPGAVRGGRAGPRRLLDGSAGTVHGRDPEDGVERITSYRKLADLPFAVSLGIARDDALAAWRAESAKRLIATFAFLALIVTLGLRMRRQFEALRVTADRLERSQHAVERSESRYALAALGSNEGLFEWDLSGGRYYFSPRFLEIVGDAVERIPVGFVQFDAKDRLIACNSRYRQALAPVSENFHPGLPFEDLIRLIAESGRYADVAAIGVEAYVRRRVEIHRQNKERGEGIERHRLADGRWIENREYRTPDGGMVLIRTDMAAADELRSNPDGWLGCIHPDDSTRVRAAFDRFIGAGDATLSLEYRIARSDGRERWIRLTAAVERDGDGRACRIAGSLGDITDHQLSEEALRRTQKMDAIGRLSGGIGHDFNNLLSIVIGNMDMIIESDALHPSDRARAETALKAALRGAALTKRLLAVARQLPAAKRVSDINAVVASMHGMLQRALTTAIQTEIHAAPDLWAADIDPGDLEDSILNLAINARDAMPSGGRLVVETANVRLDDDYAARNAGVAPGEYVMIAITDTGCGMSKATLEKAFEPFFSTKAPGSGTGLGLSMVYGFVKRSAGHVAIYSEPGHGTTVRIYLPRAAAPAETGANGKSRPEGLPRGSEKVLVVDDEEDLRKLAVGYLTDLGYRTVAAADGPAALRIIESDRDIDVLFSDVLMPGGLNGYDLAADARRRVPGLKVLLTSGFSRHAVPTRRDDAGELLVKPFRKVDLARKIREVIDATQ